jgi:hypothetical protein
LKVFKPRLNGFSLPKRNLETLPEKGLFSKAPIGHEPPVGGLRENGDGGKYSHLV